MTIIKEKQMKQLKENQLGKGIDIESEHKQTYIMLQKYLDNHGILPPKELLYKSIAQDHLDEIDNYYTRLTDAGL